MNTKLRNALAAAGLSQSELARRIGVDQSQVNRWVSGRLVPTYPQLCRALAFLDTFEETAGVTAETLGYAVVDRPTVRRLA
jgi:transcriptional regulator with XRE-family HTH domain